jgi:uncharacterized protein (TIGR02001 family)
MKALKIALLAATATVAMGGAALAQDDAGPSLSFNIGAATDYVFRGVSQTYEDGQIYGGADLSYGMFYAGVWASNVDFGDDTDAEIDGYVGVKPTVGPVALDLAAIYYGYVNEPSGADYAYWEFKAAGSLAAGPATIGAAVYYSPDFTNAVSDEAWYYELNGSVPVHEKITLSAAIGHQEVEGGSAALGNEQVDYNTWNVGASFAANEHFGVDVRYWDTDEHDAFTILDPVTGNVKARLGDERIVIGLKATF